MRIVAVFQAQIYTLRPHIRVQHIEPNIILNKAVLYNWIWLAFVKWHVK